MLVLSAIGIVCLYALSEYLMVRWTQSVVGRRPLRASLLAGVIRAISVVGLLAVVYSPLLAIAAIVGDMVGSYIGAECGDCEEEDDDGYQDSDYEEAGERFEIPLRVRASDGATWEDYSPTGSRTR